jgi:hypothetical protein
MARPVASATLTLGGREAARLSITRIERKGDQWVFEAAVVSADGYWLEHGRSFTLDVVTEKRTRRYRDVELTRRGDGSIRLATASFGEVT